MKPIVGMMVWHEQCGAGKVIEEDGDRVWVAFLQYAEKVLVETKCLRICNMVDAWIPIQELFRARVSE